MLAGQGIFRNELNRAFSHLGREQRLQVLLESHTWAFHSHHSPWLPGWKKDGGARGVLAPHLLSRLFPAPHLALSSHEATPEPPPVLALRNFLCSMRSPGGNVFNPWEWKKESKHKRKIKCCISEQRYLHSASA